MPTTTRLVDPVHLAIDLGASSGRVMAGSIANGKLSLETIYRFANDPVHVHDTMQWNPLALWSEITTGLRKAASMYENIESVGVDTWGVDYALICEQDLVAGPIRHYRDKRTVGMMERVFGIISRDEIFAATGLQFMELNTLYQLAAAKLSGDPTLDIGEDFLMMGDYFHWLLSGKRGVEVTNASTTQLLDPRTRQWSEPLIDQLKLPRKIFGELIQPGTNLGNVTATVTRQTDLKDVPVVVPATHDTASAVLAVPANNFAPEKPDWCYISSGTWSLMGCELPKPMINDDCAKLNFTNEGGAFGSTRLLQNIGGLWIFQQIRASMMRRGVEHSWAEMVDLARQAPAFACIINPDDSAFVAPDDMVDAISQRATQTDQSPPADEASLYRSALEGLALRYRVCLGMLESLVGNKIETIHIVGGGSVNELLCQMTADACDRQVVAGPVEATAIGNVMMQMIGTGKLSSIDEGRQLVRDSFETKSFSPIDSQAWNDPMKKFVQIA